MLRCPLPRILRAILTCLSSFSVLPLNAQIVAYEAYSGYSFDLSMLSPDQVDPPAESALTGYDGGNIHVDIKPRADSLIYGSLETSGGKLDLNSGGVWLTGHFDTSAGGPFDGYLQNGLVGADNTTLWISQIIQLQSTQTGSTQAQHNLAEGTNSRFVMGQLWGQNTFANTGGVPLDTEAHLYVVKIEYQAGNDTATVWFDPDLSQPIESQTPTHSTNGNFAFSGLRGVGQGNAIFVDELRIGADAASVVPTLDTYSLTLSDVAEGEVLAFPSLEAYTLGAEVRVEATGAFGYAFKEWLGDVPAGKENLNPLKVTMDQNRTLTPVFEEGVPGFFNFDPGADPYTGDSVFDLRRLNEERAGQNGFVTKDGDKFLLGDGSSVRFWSATVGTPEGENLDEMVRFLGKRGVNMVRWHTSVYNNGAPNMGDVKGSSIDNLHRLVVAARAQGIYTKISHFFILGLRIQPEWGIDGYTEQWLADNPDKADSAPFALQFFDEDFKAAYKSWTREVLTRPNPHDEDETPLAEEPAVAVVEIQNEDNVFF